MTSSPPTPPDYVLDLGGRLDFDALFTRCPSCGFVAASGSSICVVAPDGSPDLTQPIRLSCGLCAREAEVTPAVFLTRDAVRRCGRVGCDTDIACPASADEVICLICRMHQPGPHVDADRRAWLDRMRADYLAGVHALMRARRGQP
jgi:hypothetical protein